MHFFIALSSQRILPFFQAGKDTGQLKFAVSNKTVSLGTTSYMLSVFFLTEGENPFPANATSRQTQPTPIVQKQVRMKNFPESPDGPHSAAYGCCLQLINPTAQWWALS